MLGRDAAGEYVPLSDQDVSLWDDEMIDDADALLRRASALNAPGRYQLEAAVQSAHAVRRETGRADWPAIEKIYDGLLAVTGSPVVAINRAVAISQTRGGASGMGGLTRRLRTIHALRIISPIGPRAAICSPAR